MSPDRYRTLAGVSIVGVGALMILGFTTAEAFYPGYSTSGNTISALGSASGTATSRLVFNGVMVLSGCLMAVAAYALQHVYERRSLTALVGVTGLVGFAGVGLFPAQTGLPHVVAALVSFIGSGLTALVVASVVRGPFRFLSVVLGVLELCALGLFVTLGGSTPLGIGGLERWVAFLGTVWAIAFGGFLLPGETVDG